MPTRFKKISLFFSFLSFAFVLNACKKEDDSSIGETRSGLNTLFVEVDGARYQPRKFVYEYIDGRTVPHNGVEFGTLNKFLQITHENFERANIYSFSSNAILTTPVWTKVSFGLVNVPVPGGVDEQKPIQEGRYSLRSHNYSDNEGKITALLSYSVSNNDPNWSDVRTYNQKPGTGDLTITRLTDKIISGRMETTVELGSGDSYESKKIVVYFDYTMNTINSKVFN